MQTPQHGAIHPTRREDSAGDLEVTLNAVAGATRARRIPVTESARTARDPRTTADCSDAYEVTAANARAHSPEQ